MGDYVRDDFPHAKTQNNRPIGGIAAYTWHITLAWFLPRDSYAKRGVCRRRVSVCVCLSHSGIVSKRLNVGSHKQRRTIAPWL